MKKQFLVVLLAMPCLFPKAQTQFLRYRASPEFQQAFSRIVEEFPANFKNITGNLVLAQGEWEQYESTISLPGAIRCLVTRFHSALDTTASWQALMFENEDFAKAAAEYRRLFQELKRGRITVVDGSKYYFDAHFEAPATERDFCVSTLTLRTADDRFRNFKIELELLYQMDSWQVNVNMVNRKPDDEQGPDWDN